MNPNNGLNANTGFNNTNINTTTNNNSSYNPFDF